MKATRLVIYLITLVAIICGCAGNISKGTIMGKQHNDYMQITPALLRLEDVGPGLAYQDEERLQKLYAIAEYLHEEGIPFHISLIPRIVEPASNYDVTIADNTTYTKNFITIIKNMEKLGGIVGIHGYTHQSGSIVSAEGFEFYGKIKNRVVPNGYDYAKERIDNSLNLCEEVGIKPSFWETPHYTASNIQYSAFEKQMGLFFENGHGGKNENNVKATDITGNGYRGYITVPTPFGVYEPEKSPDQILKILDSKKNKGQLASLFYHPFKEFNYLYKSYNDKGEVYFIYDQNSPLHQLVKAFKDRGYTFVSVYSLVGFVPGQRLDNFNFEEGDAAFTGNFCTDGKKDILLWNKSSSEWHLFEYTSDWYAPRDINAFSDRGIWLKDWPAANSASPLIGHFASKSRDELMFFNNEQGAFYLAVNDGSKFTPAESFSLKLTEPNDLTPLAGDFNGDGLSDLAIFDPDNQRLKIAINNDREFVQEEWQFLDRINKNQMHLVGDFNKDGIDEIAVLDIDSGECELLSMGPNGYFLAGQNPWIEKNVLGSIKNKNVLAADVNGDGSCDLIYYDKKGTWQIAISDGAKFHYWGDFGPWGASEAGVPLLADLNGDHRADLIMINANKSNNYSIDMAMSVFDR